jgi:hypothetical protein
MQLRFLSLILFFIVSSSSAGWALVSDENFIEISKAPPIKGNFLFSIGGNSIGINPGINSPYLRVGYQKEYFGFDVGYSSLNTKYGGIRAEMPYEDREAGTVIDETELLTERDQSERWAGSFTEVGVHFYTMIPKAKNLMLLGRFSFKKGHLVDRFFDIKFETSMLGSEAGVQYPLDSAKKLYLQGWLGYFWGRGTNRDLGAVEGTLPLHYQAFGLAINYYLL